MLIIISCFVNQTIVVFSGSHYWLYVLIQKNLKMAMSHYKCTLRKLLS